MKRILYPIICLLTLVSCAEQYKIAGNSNVTSLDGRMLYLKVAGDSMFYALDSCEVIHGKFSFNGAMDSTMMAEIYMDNRSLLPVVIENADITVLFSNIEQRVSGGPLNERLYKFLSEKDHLLSEYMELPRKRMQMMLRGDNPIDIQQAINHEAQELSDKIENLETTFVMNNYDNVLGTSYFLYICNQLNYPIMTDQIKVILEKAPKHFLANPLVNNYVTVANANMNSMRHFDNLVNAGN